MLILFLLIEDVVEPMDEEMTKGTYNCFQSHLCDLSHSKFLLANTFIGHANSKFDLPKVLSLLIKLLNVVHLEKAHALVCLLSTHIFSQILM